MKNEILGLTEFQRVIWEYYEQSNTHKFDNINGIDQVLKNVNYNLFNIK